MSRKPVFFMLLLGPFLGAIGCTTVQIIIGMAAVVVMLLILNYPKMLEEQEEQIAADEAKEEAKRASEIDALRRATEDRREEEMHQARLKAIQTGRESVNQHTGMDALTKANLIEDKP